MKFKHKLEFNTTEELSSSFKDGNKTISDAIVDVALKNLKTKRKNIPVIQFTTKDDGLIYDVIIERPDMVETLEQNLEVMEYKHKIIAVSRDLLVEYPKGTKVCVAGTTYDGVYVVMDKMNKRYTDRIDLLINEEMQIGSWPNATITKL